MTAKTLEQIEADRLWELLRRLEGLSKRAGSRMVRDVAHARQIVIAREALREIAVLAGGGLQP
jgi:hypothetical protein